MQVALFLAALGYVSATEPTLESRIRASVVAPLVADALSLSTHYEYDAIKIKKFYGVVDQYYSPGEKTGGQTHGIGWGQRNYHGGNGNGPAKSAGEQTDYGDYTILILDHLAATADNPRPLDLNELLPRWQTAMKTWRSWICTQSRQTMRQIRQGVPNEYLGGNSNAMGIRAAAALGYYESEEEVVQAARVAMFTHQETTAHQGNEFFMRVAYRVLHQKLTPREAIVQVAAESSKFIQDKVKQALDKVEEALDPARPLINEEYVDDLALTSMARLWMTGGRTEPIKVGKASPTTGTLPGSIYLIVKYQGDFKAAAVANAMIGGDNASRAIAIGLVMGAHQGMSAIPDNLGEGHLVEFDRVNKLIDKLPLIVKQSKSEL